MQISSLNMQIMQKTEKMQPLGQNLSSLSGLTQL